MWKPSDEITLLRLTSPDFQKFEDVAHNQMIDKMKKELRPCYITFTESSNVNWNKLINNKKSMFGRKKSIRKEIEDIKGRANFSESVNSVHATEIANLKKQVSAMDARMNAFHSRLDKMRNNIATDTCENYTLIMELAKTLGYTFTLEEHEGISDTTGEHDTVSKLVFKKKK